MLESEEIFDEKNAVGSIVEMIIAATDALIARLQQVFMLIDHAETKMTVHYDDELGECHTFNPLPPHRNAPCPSR